jgi:uncharacterized protein
MSNRLAAETSPYLLQHADNPVDWYAWNEEALALAREQDKPILLSIGYSACHWCHVMAHESFEDPVIAEQMNQGFINIKVDREERPDIDRIYQTAHQLMMQRGGGWPLTVVLDPRTHAPFFAGTYFPPKPRHGMPAFRDLLRHVSDWYAKNKDQLAGQDTRLREVMQKLEPQATNAAGLNDSALSKALVQLERNFDRDFGGFADAPKFPHAPQLELLLRLCKSSPPPQSFPSRGEGERNEGLSAKREAVGKEASSPLVGEGQGEGGKDMALYTLRKMAEGGLFDQLGGGFCRYSVDAQWMIPHFEKMLYDNGPLLALCSIASTLDPDPVFADAAAMTANWVLREMQSPEGGYYSSLDADSEGHEGKFYVWAQEEIAAALPEQDYPLFARRFGLDRAPNFEGRWHLHVHESIESLAAEFQQPAVSVRARLKLCAQILLGLREQRIRPGRDDKILTSWNALMVQGMAVAARHLSREDCLRSAQRAVDFIRDTLWREGRLLATCKDGKAHLPAYLDDHAFLLDALLELMQLEWRSQDLVFAQALAETLLTQFEDPEQGGFFFTAHGHEKLLARMKNLADEALPSGNGVAARALNRLGWLLAEPRYLAAAERTLRLASQAMDQHPLAYPTLLMALQETLQPPELFILRGTPDGMREWHSKLTSGYRPDRLIFSIPADKNDLPAALLEKRAAGDIVAYRCVGTQCSAPILDLTTLD